MKAFGFPFQKNFYSLAEAVEIGKLTFPKLTANDLLHLGCLKQIFFLFILPRKFTATFSQRIGSQQGSEPPISPRFVVIGSDDCLDLQCFGFVETAYFPNVWLFGDNYYPGDTNIQGNWTIKSATEAEITTIKLNQHDLHLSRQQVELALKIFSNDAIDKNNEMALINYHINSLQKNLYEFQSKNLQHQNKDRKKAIVPTALFSRDNPLEITIYDWMALDQTAAEKYYTRYSGELNYTERSIFRKTPLPESELTPSEIYFSLKNAGFIGLMEAATQHNLTQDQLLEICIKHDALIVTSIPSNLTIYPFESRQLRFIIHKRNAPQFAIVTQQTLKAIRANSIAYESVFKLAFNPSAGVLKLSSENKLIDHAWKWRIIGNDFSIRHIALKIDNLFTDAEALSQFLAAESNAKLMTHGQSQPVTEKTLAKEAETDSTQPHEGEIDDLLTMKETEKITKLSRTTINNKGNKNHKSYDDSFPIKRKLTDSPRGKIAYSKSAVIAWINNK